ncbi:MAG: hypothetical protein LBS99_03790 [Clostridiales bacterium]|jgi:hypothetical protein|nr:hypothetical protein [Clostridiales bacterium]
MKKGLYAVSVILCLLISCAAFVGCGKKPQAEDYFTVSVVGGTGGGNYYENVNCTVTAQIPADKQFMYWTVDEERVSLNAEYKFTVKSDVTIVAVFADSVANVGKEVFTVKIPMIKNAVSFYPEATAAVGMGGYFKDSSCTVKLKARDAERDFVGWAELISTETLGEILSADRDYTFAVTRDIVLCPVFGTEFLQLATPGNKTLQFRSPYVEFDRNGATVFAAGVGYALFRVYDNEQCAGDNVGEFTLTPKKEPTTNPQYPTQTAEYFEAYFRDKTGKDIYLMIGNKGNYFYDKTAIADQIDLFKQVIDNFDNATQYYFTAQLFGAESYAAGGVKYDVIPSAVSGVLVHYFCGDGYGGQ